MGAMAAVCDAFWWANKGSYGRSGSYGRPRTSYNSWSSRSRTSYGRHSHGIHGHGSSYRPAYETRRYDYHGGRYGGAPVTGGQWLNDRYGNSRNYDSGFGGGFGGSFQIGGGFGGGVRRGDDYEDRPRYNYNNGGSRWSGSSRGGSWNRRQEEHDD